MRWDKKDLKENIEKAENFKAETTYMHLTASTGSLAIEKHCTCSTAGFAAERGIEKLFSRIPRLPSFSTLFSIFHALCSRCPRRHHSQCELQFAGDVHNIDND